MAFGEIQGKDEMKLTEWYDKYPKFRPRKWMIPTSRTQQCGGVRWWRCPKCKREFPNLWAHHIKHAFEYLQNRKCLSTSTGKDENGFV